MAAAGVGDHAAGAEWHVESVAELTVPALQDLFSRHDSPVNPYLERNIAKVRQESAQGYTTVKPAG
jgi:hypothetical protein